MKTLSTILIFFTFLTYNFLGAQEYCKLILPGNFMACENQLGAGGLKILNGFCAEEQVVLTMTPQEITPVAFCSGSNSVLNNPSYFAFEADGTAEFSVTVSVVQNSCSVANGIQGTLVSLGDCITQNAISNCQLDCTISPFTLTTFDTPEAGDIIVLVLDGCSGTTCDVEVTFNSGWTNVPLEPEVDPEIIDQAVLAPVGETICKQVTFSIEPAFEGLCNYLWTLPDNSTRITTSNTIILENHELTDGLICAQAYSSCFPDVYYPEDLTLCYDFVNEGFEEVVITSEVSPADCYVENGSINVEAEGGSGIFQYTWLPEVSDTNFVQNVGEGTYTVQISDAVAPFCVHEIKSIYVGTTNKLQIEIIEIINATAADNDGSISFEITGPDRTYLYYLNGVEGELNQTENTITDLPAGNYNLVIIEDLGFCNQAITFTIDKPSSILGNSENIANLVITPNPTYNEIYLNTKFIGDSYHLYNLSGQELSSGILTNSRMNLIDLNNGVYILKIRTTNGKLHIGKIVKLN